MSASSAADYPHSLEIPAWKNIASHVAAVAVAVIFLSSGFWKALDPFTWSRALEEFLVPGQFSMPFTVLLAIGEMLGGIFILIPRFRRWGAVILSGLLLAFMIYVGIHYSQLVGKDCSCFPMVKRAVNPAFFVEDGAMLLAAILAGWSARPSTGMGAAAIVAALAVVFAGASYGVNLSHQTGTKAPDSITVDGKPFSLQRGHIFLFFYDPNCGHCDAAARAMAKLHWKTDVTIVAIPTTQPRFAAAFLHDTGLKAVTSLDLDLLKKTFPLPGDPPYGIVLDNGRETGPVPHYEEGGEPTDTLRKLGVIE
jgi:uncharacterized membrane protein YphA (DoxX/SURF4 family)